MTCSNIRASVRFCRYFDTLLLRPAKNKSYVHKQLLFRFPSAAYDDGLWRCVLCRIVKESASTRSMAIFIMFYLSKFANIMRLDSHCCRHACTIRRKVYCTMKHKRFAGAIRQNARSQPRLPHESDNLSVTKAFILNDAPLLPQCGI